jgi:hypothetical protein
MTTVALRSPRSYHLALMDSASPSVNVDSDEDLYRRYHDAGAQSGTLVVSV